ncbi:hypothetical protein NDU88_003188 [Pleurodeles waltl]|uniref:Uncharacterized protein n=1 Tax=Pleurodeles waltl TaxID=8319 RepID=A0AAV7QC31_PLEWA|nr:hypothetical protein NDU88_003188 [Pleurodeles waltl]
MICMLLGQTGVPDLSLLHDCNGGQGPELRAAWDPVRHYIPDVTTGLGTQACPYGMYIVAGAEFRATRDPGPSPLHYIYVLGQGQGLWPILSAHL